MVILEFDQSGQRGRIAIHGEDALGDHQDSGPAGIRARQTRGPTEDALQIVKVVVAEHPQLRPGEACRIDATGMHQSIDDHHVARSHEGGYHPGGSGMTGGKSQRGLRPEELGERVLKMMMHRQRSTDESRGGRSGTPVVDRPDRGLQHRGVLGKTQVIVAREGNQPVTSGRQLRPRAVIHWPQAAPKSLGAHRLQSLAQGFLERLGHGGRMTENPRPGHAQRWMRLSSAKT